MVLSPITNSVHNNSPLVFHGTVQFRMIHQSHITEAPDIDEM